MYVDLAGWGPDHYRLKLTGMKIMLIGELHNVELAPPSPPEISDMR